MHPTTFGKYLMLERINVGGMAEVYKAKTFGVEGFERILAIKRILPNMADDDEFINMFVDEARISVQLSHANIVQIYELGKFENQYYIAMEYVPGRDLRQFLDRLRKKGEQLPLPAVAFIISKVCDGLDYAHRKADHSGRPMNVIHRDVSPQNILVSYEGAVKVTDFGIAKAEDRASKTQAGVLKGKFGYMSPEQVRGLEIDRRSDVFAVGVLLYEMVTGKRLFIGESDFSTLEKVRNAEVIPPREINPDIPEELEQVMLKALARERDERYQWASELHDDLQQFLIEGNTIFNGKRLAALMRDEFGPEIETEMQKMEEFMRVQAPPEMRNQIDFHQAASPQGDPNWSASADNKGEKTMIFESQGGFADAPTQVSEGDPGLATAGTQTGVGGLSRSATGRPRSSRPSVSVVTTRPKSTRHPIRRKAGASWVMVSLVGVAFLALLTVLIWMFVGASETGTIIVTSTPTDKVDILLDGVLVATKTPFTQSGVAVGRHKLEVKAAGFRDRAYQFDLEADGPAMIQIQLEPDTGAGEMGGNDPPAVAGAGGDATLVIETEPPGASVRIASLPQGVTPLTLTGQDPTKTIILELSKEGFKTESKPVTFTPPEIKTKTKTVSFTLVPAGKVTGTISIESDPTNATVTVNRKKAGITPTKIDNLDPTKSYEVVVSKSGYEPWSSTVTFNGTSTQDLVAQLERSAGSAEPRRTEPAPRKQKAKSPPPRASRSGGGGGKCSGSGAKLSVMAIGAQNCKVTVGSKSLGVAPFFKKTAPTGSCQVKVTCDDGKKFSKTMTLSSGDNERVIIKDTMWK